MSRKCGWALLILGAAVYDALYLNGIFGHPALSALEQIGPQVGVIIGYLWGQSVRAPLREHEGRHP